MKKTLKEINDIISGELIGNSSVEIKNISNINDASSDTLVFLLDAKNSNKLRSSKACAAIVPKNIKDINIPHIKVDDPKLALAKMLGIFAPDKNIKPGIHKTAVIDPKASISKTAAVMAHVVIEKGSKIGNNVIIYPNSYIGNNCTVDDNTVIHPNVSIYYDTKIGKNCILHAGVVVGSDGYGFAPDGEKWIKIPQIGNVIIEDSVELNANVSIARATMGSTIIKSGTKIDNLTHIAHNCEIGENCALTALNVVAGSSTLGKHVIMGGNSAVSDHVNIGDNSIVMAKAGVIKDFPSNSVVSGFPARDHKKQLETQAALNKLPEVIKKLKDK